jgi:SAM-dependent methyltransferase
MNLIDILNRQSPPRPWLEGEKIPWNDPGFSQRMLREHLSQEHDAASRRLAVIDRHVDWIHKKLLSGQPTRVLDLGCGPGLYTSRLARLGHQCTGIDFSPASIVYASEQAQSQRLACRYVQADIRTADYGTGYGLAMLIFGELNVFAPSDARAILRRTHEALDETGILLLEPHTFAAVQGAGSQPCTWYSSDSGLFSHRKHLCLNESFWDAHSSVATQRYHIVDALTGDVTRHASSMQAYTDDQYRDLLRATGLGDIEFHAGMGCDQTSRNGSFLAITARKPRL